MALKEIRQFSHLILEENEEYIADISCNCKSNIQRRIFGKEFKGRIRIGSKSIIIEPDDSTINMIKILFTQLVNLEIKEIEKKMILSSKTIRLVNVKVIDSKSRSTTPNEILTQKGTKEKEQVFVLEIIIPNENSLNLMNLCNEFWLSYSEKPYTQSRIDDLVNKWINILYNNEIINVEYEFLADHRDHFLLSKPIIVNRIKPFTKHRGIFHIVSSGICFKSLPNFSNKAYKRIPLKNVWFIFRRIYSMKANSMEIIYGKEFNNQNLKGNSSCWRSLFLEFQTNQDREYVVAFLQSYLMNLNNKKCQWNSKSPQYATCQCLKNTSSCLPMIFVDPLYAGQSLCFKKHFQNLWINGKISTYHYLDYLNSISGRSKGDLTQYPIFPWTIINFESNLTKPDLNKISNYRNLSKPLGSLNKNNLEILKKRMKDLPYSEQFLYGSHYSTPGYISYFLVRLFPEYQLKLHCGDFDVWNRMFHSMNETWKTILEGKTTYMELIPQFYEQNSDFLLNKLSIKTNYGNLLNVQVPQWDIDIFKHKSDKTNDIESNRTKKFLKVMRYCLESEVVSENIHEWIDLIFGYKQRGTQAINSDNLFHPITYINSYIALLKDYSPVYAPQESSNEEDKAIMKKISHDNLALKAQVEEFGQVPIKLFNEPHPKRSCFVDESTIIQHINNEYSNLPWFVLIKNNPQLIESEYDFNDHPLKQNNVETQIYSFETNLERTTQYNNNNKNIKKDEFLNNDCKLDSNLKDITLIKENNIQDKYKCEDLTKNLSINLKKSLMSNFNYYDENIFNFQLISESVVNEKDTQLYGNQFEVLYSNLIDIFETINELILIVILRNNEKLDFYLSSKSKDTSFKLINSTFVDLLGNAATSLNLLICDDKVYLTIGTISGDIFYYKFKLIVQTLPKFDLDQEIYALILKDQIFKQYNMDLVELITSLVVKNHSYIIVLSIKGVILISQHSNEDENFKKSLWFPVIDIPIIDEQITSIANINIDSSNTKNDLQIIQNRSKFLKITKDINKFGLKMSFILSNKNSFKKKFWYIGKNDLFSLDIFNMISWVFSIQNNKGESLNYGLKEIENSKPIGWETSKENNLLFYICYNEDKILSTILIWNLMEKDTKIHKIIFVPNTEIQKFTWDKYRKGIILITGTIDSQKKQEKSIYFFPSMFWSTSNSIIQTLTLKDSFVLLLNITQLTPFIDQDLLISIKKITCNKRYITLILLRVIIIFYLENNEKN